MLRRATARAPLVSRPRNPLQMTVFLLIRRVFLRSQRSMRFTTPRGNKCWGNPRPLLQAQLVRIPPMDTRIWVACPLMLELVVWEDWWIWAANEFGARRQCASDLPGYSMKPSLVWRGRQSFSPCSTDPGFRRGDTPLPAEKRGGCPAI